MRVAAMWWVYFDRGLGGGLNPSPVGILILAYVHIPLLAALTAVGAGVHLLVEEAAEHHVGAGAAWALGGGAALYLVCVSVTQHYTTLNIRVPVKVARGAAALALIALAATAGELDPVAFTALSAAALGLLVLFEIRSGPGAATSGV